MARAIANSPDEESRPEPRDAQNTCEDTLPIPAPWEPTYGDDLEVVDFVPELVMKCAGPQENLL